MADVELSYRVEDGGATQATAALTASMEQLVRAEQESAAQARAHAEQMRASAVATLQQEKAADAAAAKLARLSDALSRQKVGAPIFDATRSLTALEELRRDLRLTGQYSAQAAATIDESADQIRSSLASATAEAARLRAGMAGTSGPAASGAAALGQIDTAATKAAGGMSVLKSSLGGVAQQMPDVVASLASGASPMTVLIQQGLQVAQTTQGLGGALASLAGPLAVVGIAVAALGTAYLVYRNAAEAAADASGRLEARVKEAGEAVRDARQRVIDGGSAWGEYVRDVQTAETDLAVLVGTKDKYDVQAERRIAQLEKNGAAEVQAASLVVAQLERQIEANNALAASSKATRSEQIAATDANSKLARELKQANDALAERKAVLERGREVVLQSAEYSRELEEQERRLASARSAGSKAADTSAERERLLAELRKIERQGLSELARATLELADRKADLTAEATRLGVPLAALAPAFAQLDLELQKVARSVQMAQATMEFEQMLNASARNARQAAEALTAFYSALERVPQGPRSELERIADSTEALTLAEVDLQLQVARGIVTDQQAAAAADDLAAARQRLADASRAARLGVATSLVQGVASGPSGAITAGLTAAGVGAPVTSLVGAGLGLAAAAGAPGADFSKQFQQQMDAILRGVLKLPGELVQIAADLVTDLPMILADGLPAFTSALVEAGVELLQVILDPRAWVQVAEAIVMGLLRSIGVVAQAIVKGLATLATVDFWRDVGRAFVDALIDMINIFDEDGRDRRQSRRERRQEERAASRRGEGDQQFAGGGDRPRSRSASGPGGGRQGPSVHVQVLGSVLGSQRDLARAVSEAQRLGYRTSWER